MSGLVYVFIGGGAGSLCRYALSLYNDTDGGIPWGTVMANVVACAILGALLGYHERQPDILPMLLLSTGFCGGFSTFSTFSAESLKLIQAGAWQSVSVYIVGSIVMGLAAVLLGYKMAS